MQGAGLNFIQSLKILIDSIEFLHCGSLQTSTSRRDGAFLPVSIAVYFQFCLNITLASVNITNSSGIGVAIVGSGGVNYVQNSRFYHNGPAEEDYGGGGLKIEFPYCYPVGQNGCKLLSNSEYNSDAVYEIINCEFKGNKAAPVPNRPSYYQFLPPDPERHTSIGHGGGLGLHFCNASNIQITINDTAFVGNTAYYGAGISCSFEEYSVNNTVLVAGSSSDDGTCSIANNMGLRLQNQTYKWGPYGAGGGIRTVFWFSHAANNSYNTLNVNKCHFDENSAYFGGAALIRASPEVSKTDPTNSVSFTDCEWTRNSGDLGGVALITPYNETMKRGALLKPIFDGCTFQNNKGNLVVNYLPVAFQKSVYFVGNTRLPMSAGVLTVNEATVEFHGNCLANFTGNKGHYGGAITLYGLAFLRVFPNTTFVFRFNYASRDGGAIYQSVSEVYIFQNGPCFVQYHDRTVPPTDWNTRFVFDSNRENVRTGHRHPVCNSIVLGSAVPCIWEGYTYEKRQSEEVFRAAICKEWNSFLEFRSDNCTQANGSRCSECTCHIHTKPSNITRAINELVVIPGQPVTLGLELLDDLGSNVSYKSILNVWTANSTTMNLSEDTFYMTGDSLAMYSTPGSVGELYIDTLPPQPLFTSIKINFTHCPPGFVRYNISSKGSLNLPTCECKKGYGGRITCDGSGTAYLSRGYWIGKIKEKDDYYVVGRTPYIYSESYFGTPLPKKDSSSSKLNDVLCGPLHREGILCGKCKHGYITPLYTYLFKSCVKCKPHDSYGWIVIVLLELAPVTIFLIVVLVFNISATTGPMNFFVFFAQVIPHTFSVNANNYLAESSEFFTVLQRLYSTLYSFWRLEIEIPHEWCFTHPVPSPEIFLIIYGQALYTLLLLLIFLLFVKLHDHGVQPFYCCGKWLYEKLRRFRKPWTVQRSIIHALATFLVLSFTKIVEASFILIALSRLVNHSGETVALKPLHYGARSALYPIFALVAVTFLTVFALVPMLLLLVIPTNTRLGNFMCDKIFIRVLRLNPNNTKLQIFLQVFQGSFKDGSGSKHEKSCQKFAGFYLFLRFVTFMLAKIFAAPEYLLGQQVVVVAAIVMFALFRPYREPLYNLIDVLAFAMLAVINSITIYHVMVELVGQSMSVLLLAFQYFLVFLPLLILTVVVIWKTVKHFNGNRKLKSYSFLWRGRRMTTATDEEFLSFVTATRDRENDNVGNDERIEAALSFYASVSESVNS